MSSLSELTTFSGVEVRSVVSLEALDLDAKHYPPRPANASSTLNENCTMPGCTFCRIESEAFPLQIRESVVNEYKVHCQLLLSNPFFGNQ